MLKLIATTTTATAITLLAASTSAAPPSPTAGDDELLEWCLLNNGENTSQPPGSGIQACCVEGEGCIICDANWSDCVFDPGYSVQGSALPRFEDQGRLATPQENAEPSGPTTVRPENAPLLEYSE